jgi:hypothetical protein
MAQSLANSPTVYRPSSKSCTIRNRTGCASARRHSAASPSAAIVAGGQGLVGLVFFVVFRVFAIVLGMSAASTINIS